jgi:hyaluronoglucosaminidase
VTFNLMVSPGLSICYSSPADQQRLIQKLEVAWGLGVRSFSIALDDLKTPRRPHCASDLAFLRRPGGLASAQAELINAIDTRFIATHPGAEPLIAVPTEYNGLESTPYKRAFAAGLSNDVIVMWTGRNGISDAIDSPQAAAARRIYGHKILIWDNFFVNDYALGYLVLGPLERHDATLPRWALGLAADPMVQPESSKIGLFTVADYTWNPRAYDPIRSWEASLREFAGGNPAGIAALRQFADANWGSPVTHAQAPSLAAGIGSFWSDWRRGDASAAARLDARLRALEGTPVVIRARVPNPGFLAESGAWLNATRAWASTARVALDMLTARYHRRTAQALADEVKLPGLTANAQQYSTFKTQTRLADGVIDRFIEDAQLYRAPEVRGRR